MLTEEVSQTDELKAELSAKTCEMMDKMEKWESRKTEMRKDAQRERRKIGQKYAKEMAALKRQNQKQKALIEKLRNENDDLRQALQGPSDDSSSSCYILNWFRGET